MLPSGVSIPSPTPSVSAKPPVESASLGPKGSNVLPKIHFRSDTARRIYQRAAAALPGFCRHWEHNLQLRVVRNLSHLKWKSKNGYKTATYIGYGQIEQCECKESAEGIPIADITYEQYNYNLVGKTPKEALGSDPKLLKTTTTLEIFSWDRDKWFY